MRVVWVLGQDGKPERRRITVGLSDGSATEVVDGDLKEGDMVITGQTDHWREHVVDEHAETARIR